MAELRFVDRLRLARRGLTELDCWPWAGRKDQDGYGVLSVDGKDHKAHRIAWADKHGPIPLTLCVLHHCDNPPCINPAHLFLGTPTDNMTDRDAKGRQSRGPRHSAVMFKVAARGENNGARLHPDSLARGDRNGARRYPERLRRGEQCSRSKLSRADVLAIRHLAGIGIAIKALARQFFVTPPAIRAVVRRRVWTHV